MRKGQKELTNLSCYNKFFIYKYLHLQPIQLNIFIKFLPVPVFKELNYNYIQFYIFRLHIIPNNLVRLKLLENADCEIPPLYLDEAYLSKGPKVRRHTISDSSISRTTRSGCIT